jgi:hypothetical protein
MLPTHETYIIKRDGPWSIIRALMFQRSFLEGVRMGALKG